MQWTRGEQHALEAANGKMRRMHARALPGSRCPPDVQLAVVIGRGHELNRANTCVLFNAATARMTKASYMQRQGPSESSPHLRAGATRSGRRYGPNRTHSDTR